MREDQFRAWQFWDGFQLLELKENAFTVHVDGIIGQRVRRNAHPCRQVKQRARHGGAKQQ
jgi:hypothetical protein